MIESYVIDKSNLNGIIFYTGDLVKIRIPGRISAQEEKMKQGQRVKIINLDYYRDTKTKEQIKRDKKLVGKEGIIDDIYLGVFKVVFEDGEVEKFDGRELEFAEKLVCQQVDLVFVSWQKSGKTVFGTEDEFKLFAGDFRRGVHFKGSIELDEEEIRRIQEAGEKGVRPVFDLYVLESDK